ncbi:MAG: ABC transporter substrate-binding protein [Hyphomicrobiaceae bacterium]
MAATRLTSPLKTVLVAALLAVSATASGAAQDAQPQRIVSLNVCADQLLIDLVDPSRIAAVSYLAADPSLSVVAAKARGLPVTRGEAESVLAFDPDLILAGAYSTPATVSILERLGRRVVKVGQADDLEGVRRITRQVAKAVGETQRGEALIARMDQKISKSRAGGLARQHGQSLSALVYQVNGLSAGPGTLADALLQLAGFRNQATVLGLGAGARANLETLVENPPDLIVLSGPKDEYRTVVAENLRHPALAHVIATHAAVVVPWRYWLCSTPHVAEAVDRLAAARSELEAGRTGR